MIDLTQRINRDLLQHAVETTVAGVLLRRILERPSLAGSKVTEATCFDVLKRPNGGKISRQAGIAALKALAAAKCGSFKHGRRNFDSRLEWHADPVAVARIAFNVNPAGSASRTANEGQSPAQGSSAQADMSQTAAPERSGPVVERSAGAVERKAAAAEHREAFELRFPIRRGFEARIQLPWNLSEEERQRLAMAIAALPVVKAAA